MPRIERSPIIAIMGHIDHGKSTLLDFIRKTKVVDTEAGGITQRISAYEVSHTTKEGKKKDITFLDTPGHEAFGGIRVRGATVADIAILVVAADDGVKPQTIEALKTIRDAKIPFIVAINKIDKEGVNIETTKTSLAENDVYVEGFGGDVPFVAISAKTGEGVPELLDMMVLVADVAELTGDRSKPAEGIIIEADLDKRKGISATVILTDGTLKSGEYISAGTAGSPVRMMENFLGKQVKEASFSSPVRIIGWSALPQVGSHIKTFKSKKEFESYLASPESRKTETPKGTKENNRKQEQENASKVTIPLIVKATEAGGLEAIEHELKKMQTDKIILKVIQSGVGDITENDVKAAGARDNAVILGFNVKVDSMAKSQIEKTGITIETFDIIYKLSDWLKKVVEERTPKERVEEATGTAKVLKIFSETKDKQILGGRVESGEIRIGAEVKILRRDFEIGKGKVRELQKAKNKVSEVPEGQEFGAMVESKTDIAPGDRLQAFMIVEK